MNEPQVEIISEFIKITGHEVNLKKNQVFLHWLQTIEKINFRNQYHINSTHNRNKCSKRCLTKDHKTSQREIKENITNGKKWHVYGLENVH